MCCDQESFSDLSCQSEEPTGGVLWRGDRGAARREAEAWVDGVRWDIRHDFFFV